MCSDCENKNIDWKKADKNSGFDTGNKKKKSPMIQAVNPSGGLFTIGHSNHDIDYMIELLQSQDITFVIDVRSRPRSRYCPQYNKEAFQRSLKAVGIDYANPKVLGGIEWHETDMVEYKRVIEKTIAKSKNERVALCCSEGDPFPNYRLPSGCHRFWKITRNLIDEYGIYPTHIIKDKSTLIAKDIDYLKLDVNGEKLETQKSLDL